MCKHSFAVAELINTVIFCIIIIKKETARCSYITEYVHLMV